MINLSFIDNSLLYNTEMTWNAIGWTEMFLVRSLGLISVLVSLAFFGKMKNLLKDSIFLIGMRLIKVSTPLSYMRAQVNQKNPGLQLTRELSVQLSYGWICASGQDETNPEFWLANQEGSGFLALVPKKMLSFWLYNKSFIDQACSIKMAVYWPRLGQ